MSSFDYDKIVKYKVSAKTNSHLHIGSSNGDKEDVLVDEAGTPYIQASTLAGLLRSVNDATNGKSSSNELFGYSLAGSSEDNSRSRLRISDGIMEEEKIKLEIRPLVSIDRKTGAAKKHFKSETTYVAAGVPFDFEIYLYYDENHENLKTQTEKMLSVLEFNDIRLGSKKSSGAGSIGIKDIEYSIYDMKDGDDRKAWARETKPMNQLVFEEDANVKQYKYTITVKAKTEGPLLVKSLYSEGFGKDAEDNGNIRNANGDYVIPGTSIRGSIRSQMEKIAAYLNKGNVIENSFGKIDENNHDNSKPGNLLFTDVVVGHKETNQEVKNRTRIHIDKFTGGVMYGALFSEKNIIGDMTIDIKIADKNDPDATLGLLLFALRDLAVHSFNLGSGYATGKGFVDVSEIIIRDNHSGEDDHILVAGKDTAWKGRSIEKALEALKEVHE